MEKISPVPKIEERAPTESEVSDYFRKLGIRFRQHFRLLREEPFRVAGHEAKKDGWFINYRNIVEAALALKLSTLLDLNEEDRRLLSEAAFVNAAMRRVQFEQRGSNVTSQERETIDREGDQKLIASGIDPQSIDIGRAAGARLLVEIAIGLRDERWQASRLGQLSQYFAFIHNSTDIQIFEDSSGKKSHETRVIDWRAHMDAAEKRYPEIAAEIENVNGVAMRNFDIQRMVLEKIESEIADKIRRTHPEVAFLPGESLSKFIARQLDEDIKLGIVPDVPSR